MISNLRDFLKLEAASGILLIIAAILALVLANSPLANLYAAFLDTPVAIQFGKLEIAKPLLLWINDGLMAVFFFLVGLELKREFLEGELSQLSQVALPAMAAIGGMLVPAAIYAWFNWDDPVRLNGWAVPAATDIAFALGVLALLGNRVPVPLKVFLMTLAVMDDLGAIVIIAMFFTEDLSVGALIGASFAILCLLVLRWRKVAALPAYLIVGLILWVSVLKSGVHATLAGVILGFFIPMRDSRNPEHSPLRELEHELHPTVAFVILPLFAFANAGVGLGGVGLDALLQPVSLGVLLGLVLGKQLGVFGVTWLAVRLGLAERPGNSSWLQLYAVAVLCGIGFTMSLFIGSLAFEHQGQHHFNEVRLGILAASLLAAVGGYLLMRHASQRRR